MEFLVVLSFLIFMVLTMVTVILGFMATCKK